VTSSFSSSLVGGTITNAGTFSPSDMGVNNGTINNLASGYVNVGTSWFAGTGTNLLRNSGTILASFGTFSSSSTLSIPLVNSGTIVATSLGTINFSTLTFSGGSFTHLDGAVLKGAGSGFLDLGSFSSTSHTFAGNVTILGSVFMSGAVIGGPGDMNIGGSSGSGGFSLGSGTIGGSGAINIATNGAFGGAGTVSRRQQRRHVQPNKRQHYAGELHPHQFRHDHARRFWKLQQRWNDHAQCRHDPQPGQRHDLPESIRRSADYVRQRQHQRSGQQRLDAGQSRLDKLHYDGSAIR
jgi:hypothetical protein